MFAGGWAGSLLILPRSTGESEIAHTSSASSLSGLQPKTTLASNAGAVNQFQDECHGHDTLGEIIPCQAS